MIPARAVRLLIALAIIAGGAAGAQAQSGYPEGPGSIRVGPAPALTAPFETARSIEREVHAAIMAEEMEDIRDAHIERALELSRRFVEVSPTEADAQYWLAVSLGIKTEYSGAFAKLTSGKECYEVTMRTLELQPDHAGAHEMLGRIHAGVMRLPWLVRKLGGSLGMNDALGQASWESAEAHLLRATELDARAVTPRVELGKLLADRDRPVESQAWFALALELEPRSDLERAMQAEVRELVAGPG